MSTNRIRHTGKSLKKKNNMSVVSKWIAGIRAKTESYRYVIGVLGAVVICVSLILTVERFSEDSKADQTWEFSEIEEFPESYQEGLKKVKESIPNARFVKFDTQLEWKDMFEEDNLMYFSRQLLPNTKDYPSSWKDTSYHSGSFDWTKNDWVILSDPFWVQASEPVVEYFVDPRNFLDESGIFMFEQQGYNSELQTLEGTDDVLINTWMHSSAGNYVEVEMGDGSVEKRTYAQVLYDIGVELGVSPYMLATRIRQEQGSGTSELITGNVEDYEGFYNYFNIRASGETREEIIENGMKEAVEGGWNTRYKAIYGGCKKIADSYISTGRDTLYLQKFNFVKGKGWMYMGYMQNILAPQSEASSVYKSYVENEMLSTATFTFVIPVFNNMPEKACPKPEKDGNPNNMLKDMTLADGTYSIGKVSRNTMNYSTVVPYDQETLDISVTLYSDTCSVLFGDSEGTQNKKNHYEFDGEVELVVGSNKIPIEIKAENGDTRTYNLVVRRQTEEEVQVTAIPEISWNGYTVDEESGYVTGIEIGTTVEDFCSNLNVKNGSYSVIGSDGSTMAHDSDNVITTATVVVVSDATGKKYATFSTVIFGDANCDGVITVRDMLQIKREILDIVELDDIAVLACDANHDNEITVRDMLAVKREMLDIMKIDQNR